MPTPDDFRRLDRKLQRWQAEHPVLFEAVAIVLALAMFGMYVVVGHLLDANK
jgi:hypothetical protein